VHYYTEYDSVCLWVTVGKSKHGTASKRHQVKNCDQQPTALDMRAKDKTFRNKKIVGARTSTEGAVLKSGIAIVQKTVVHVDNLNADCTEALLNDYLLANDIPVISCYKAKSWLKGSEERENVTAFRVCVKQCHKTQIFNPDLWEKGVIVRAWRFKKQ
jgi:hypothetical protein